MAKLSQIKFDFLSLLSVRISRDSAITVKKHHEIMKLACKKYKKNFDMYYIFSDDDKLVKNGAVVEFCAEEFANSRLYMI